MLRQQKLIGVPNGHAMHARAMHQLVMHIIAPLFHFRLVQPSCAPAQSIDKAPCMIMHETQVHSAAPVQPLVVYTTAGLACQHHGAVPIIACNTHVSPCDLRLVNAVICKLCAAGRHTSLVSQILGLPCVSASSMVPSTLCLYLVASPSSCLQVRLPIAAKVCNSKCLLR